MAEKIISLARVFAQTTEKFPEIVYVGESVLRKKAKETTIEKGKEIGKQLGDVLIRYRKETGIGRGLAAPQIGIGERVFVTFLDEEIQIYINPEIIWKSEETNFYRELCLSSGMMSADVERPQSITMKWFDENGEEHEQTFDGFLARLMQHEYDHLDGIVNLDKAVPGTIEMATFNPLEEQLRNKPLT